MASNGFATWSETRVSSLPRPSSRHIQRSTDTVMRRWSVLAKILTGPGVVVVMASWWSWRGALLPTIVGVGVALGIEHGGGLLGEESPGGSVEDPADLKLNVRRKGGHGHATSAHSGQRGRPHAGHG